MMPWSPVRLSSATVMATLVVLASTLAAQQQPVRPQDAQVFRSSTA